MDAVLNLARTNLIEAAFLAHENPVFVVSWKTHRILATSDSVVRVFGWRPEQIRDCTPGFLYPDEAGARTFEEIKDKALEAGRQIYHGGVCMKRRDGAIFTTDHMVGVIRDHSGQPVASVSVVRDRADSGDLRLPIDEESVDLAPLSDQLPGGIFQCQRYPDGTLSYNLVRGNFLSNLGLNSDEVSRDAHALLEQFHPDDRARHEHALERTSETLAVMDIEVVVYALDGTPFCYRSISLPRRLEDGSTTWDGLIIDVTEQRRAEKELQYWVMHDHMTGLPNITAFDARLEDVLARARGGQPRVLVGVLDVNHLYTVNETLGFGYGDEVLQAIGMRLESRLHGNDVVARYQSDEFVIFSQEPRGNADVQRLVQQLIALFAEPLQLSSGRSVSVAVKFGFAVYSSDDDTATGLRRKADLALQRVCKSADARYEFYSAEMSNNVIEAVELERCLEEAIDQGAIIPHYQGQYSVATQKLVGMEVLARWPREDGTMTRPDRFIPVAEETGLIHPMMKTLVENVLADLKSWQDAGLEAPPAGINVSAHQVRHENFFDWLFVAVQRYGLAVSNLKVEITESAFLLDFQAVKFILEDLDNHGVCLSIDDFGTGYSSLSYLTQLPFRQLKIDRAFISGVEADTSRAAVADGIMQMGRALGMEVVAEGVETREQLDWLRQEGCDTAQGFFLGHPAGGETFREELAPPESG
jgi:diguanylate cyclase (GGDEF)-like protein/PAS domain S-box-containing protein